MSTEHYRVVWLHADGNAGENYGNHLQRVIRPCELWREDADFHVSAVGIANLRAIELALAADLLVIVQLVGAEVDGVIRQRRRLGRPTIYEINDDIGHIGNWLPAHQIMRSPLIRQQILHAALACDALQFSSQGLADRYRCLHPQRFVLEPYEPVPAEIPAKPPGFVIGWAGSSSHAEDVRAVLPVIRGFLASHPDSTFAVMGNLEGLADMLGQMPGRQLQTRPFGSYAQLQDFLAGVHVGIAPLSDSGFNRGRSDGKFVQYAAAGCVAVLSDAPAFAMHREHALLFRDNRELEQQLQALYAQRADLRQRAQGAFAWVASERSPGAVREKMRRQFRAWLHGRPALRRADFAPIPAALSAGWAQAQEAAKLNQHERCIALCLQALAIDTHCHQARWLLLQQFNGLKRYQDILDTVEHASRDTVYDDYYASLACAAAQKVNPEQQPQWLARIHSPALRSKAAGRGQDDSETYFRRLLATEPYDYFALFGLIGLLRQRDAGDPELPELLQRADLLAPDAAAAL